MDTTKKASNCWLCELSEIYPRRNVGEEAGVGRWQQEEFSFRESAIRIPQDI